MSFDNFAIKNGIEEIARAVCNMCCGTHRIPQVHEHVVDVLRQCVLSLPREVEKIQAGLVRDQLATMFDKTDEHDSKKRERYVANSVDPLESLPPAPPAPGWTTEPNF